MIKINVSEAHLESITFRSSLSRYALKRYVFPADSIKGPVKLLKKKASLVIDCCL